MYLVTDWTDECWQFKNGTGIYMRRFWCRSHWTIQELGSARRVVHELIQWPQSLFRLSECKEYLSIRPDA
jgi:hypothetical protein